MALRLACFSTRAFTAHTAPVHPFTLRHGVVTSGPRSVVDVERCGCDCGLSALRIIELLIVVVVVLLRNNSAWKTRPGVRGVQRYHRRRCRLLWMRCLRLMCVSLYFLPRVSA